jgi:hypothetical protein
MPNVYPDFGHPKGIQAAPWFSIRSGKMYPDFGHPNGIGAAPWFSIRNGEVYPDFGPQTASGQRPGSASGATSSIQISDTQMALGQRLGIPYGRSGRGRRPVPGQDASSCAMIKRQRHSRCGASVQDS